MSITRTSRLQLGAKTATIASLVFGMTFLFAVAARADIFRVDSMYFGDRMNEEYYPPVGTSSLVRAGTAQSRRQLAGFGYLPPSSKKPSKRSRRH